MSFQVMRKRCNECLYGRDKIVSDRGRKELLRELHTKDSYFICHKATIAGQTIACRGDWDARGCGQLGRIAGRLDVVQFVDEAAVCARTAEVEERPDRPRHTPTT